MYYTKNVEWRSFKWGSHTSSCHENMCVRPRGINVSSARMCDILLGRTQSEFLMYRVCLHERNHSHARENGNEKRKKNKKAWRAEETKGQWWFNGWLMHLDVWDASTFPSISLDMLLCFAGPFWQVNAATCNRLVLSCIFPQCLRCSSLQFCFIESTFRFSSDFTEEKQFNIHFQNSIQYPHSFLEFHWSGIR